MKRTFILLSFVLILILGFSSSGYAAADLSVGVKYQGDLYEQLGVELSLSHDLFFGRRLQCKGSFTTTRLSEWSLKHVLIKDEVLFTPSWHLYPGRSWDIYVPVDMGVVIFQLESASLFPGIKNQSLVCRPGLGVQFRFFSGLGAYAELGYNILDFSASMPIVTTFGVTYDFLE